MPESPTLGDLYKLKRLTDEQVTAAVSAYCADPTPGVREIAEGVSLYIAAAVLASPYAREVLALADAQEGMRWTAVRTAILLARPR
ncbi:hypothetical protein [Methylobacterium sp. WSM2598]|uniref:hypothetical protein n=1 Tax=Methylobacterium sp. WSM2598 TaxID=398261 RepID=UPI00035D8849|nr:hypothetical protein [Methylobacterium sp. WSM2598]